MLSFDVQPFQVRVGVLLWQRWATLHLHVTETSLLYVTEMSPHLLVTDAGTQVRLLQERGCWSVHGHVALPDVASLPTMLWIVQGPGRLLVGKSLGLSTMGGIDQGPGHLLVEPEEVNLMP